MIPIKEGEKRIIRTKVVRLTGSGAITVTSPQYRIVDASRDLITGITSIRNSTYRWTASSAGGAGVFFWEVAAGGTPSITAPDGVRENGEDMTLASAVAALPAGSYWYGDGDSLGFSTVYVKLADSADPDGKDAGWVELWSWSSATWDAVNEEITALFDSTVEGLTAVGRYYMQLRGVIGTERYATEVKVEVLEWGP